MGARYERISMAELEAKAYVDGDGADSAIQSDDDEHEPFGRIRPEKAAKRRRGPRNESGDDDEDDEDAGRERRRKLEGLMGAAAFGGASRKHYADSENESMLSEQSSARRREATRDAFPVRGVNCVGCALANRIGPVNKFVRDNISQMTDDALWKMAALAYKRDVAEPAEREGGFVPRWGWKDVRTHYELHASGNFVARHKMIRSLQCMRQQQEQRLVRVDNGEKELCRQGADRECIRVERHPDKLTTEALTCRFDSRIVSDAQGTHIYFNISVNVKSVLTPPNPHFADHASREPRAAAARAAIDGEEKRGAGLDREQGEWRLGVGKSSIRALLAHSLHTGLRCALGLSKIIFMHLYDSHLPTRTTRCTSSTNTVLLHAKWRSSLRGHSRPALTSRQACACLLPSTS